MSKSRSIATAAAVAMADTASLLLAILFASSRSSAPVLLGRFSLALFLAVAACTIPPALSLGFLSLAPRRITGLATRFFGMASNAWILADVFLFAFPPLLVVFAWICKPLTPLAGEWLFLAAMALFYASFAAGIAGSGGRARIKLAFFRCAGLLAAFVLVFLAAKIGLRIIYPANIFHPMLDLRPNIRVRLANDDLPGVSSTGICSTNKWGMRGEQPPEDWDDWTTIVCIGGSTTECFELDDSRTWPWLLQQNLRRDDPMIWVGNGGLGGHSTRGHLVFMREVIPVIHPDIVLFLVGANELTSFAGYDPRERASLGTAEMTFEYRIFCASRVVQLLYMFKKAWIDGVPAQGTPWASRFVPVPLSEPEDSMPEDLHDLMFDPGFTRDNVRELIRLARVYDTTPVFLTQPMLFEDTPYWRTIDGGMSWLKRGDMEYSAASVWRMVETVNSDVIDVCAEEGVPCYDLGSALSHSSAWFYDQAHFSEAGAAAVADSVAAFFRRSGLVEAR